jgi:hypothetical protein
MQNLRLDIRFYVIEFYWWSQLNSFVEKYSSEQMILGH